MLEKWSYRSALFLFLAAPVTIPLFYLPLTTDFYQFNKLALFYLLTGLGLISWLVYSIAAQSVRLTISPPLGPLLLLALLAPASAWLGQTRGAELWLTGAAVYPALTVYFWLASTLTTNAVQVKNSLLLLTVSLGAAGAAALAGFNPAGSALNLVSLLVSWLPAALVLAFKTRSGWKKISYFILAGAMVSALILQGYPAFAGQAPQKPILLSPLASWSVAVDTLKTQLFLGTGPGRFSESFTKFKPISLNQTDRWNVLFTVSGNTYLEVLTTIGLGGLTALVLALAGGLKLRRRRPGTRITGTQLALLSTFFTQIVLAAFLPFTVANWVLLTAVLALLTASQKNKQEPQVKDVILTLTAVTLIEPNETTPQQQGWRGGAVLPWAMAVPAVLGLGLFFFNLGKAYAADYYWQKSLAAAARNEGKTTYDLQVKALAIAPNNDRYRINYSNTNLALANSLASRADLSDQERQTVATLIQQAIREARIATQIAPTKAGAWANLANVYKNLVNFADGADQFAQAAYVRAIQLDPANAALRLDLGGLFYSTKKYDLARDRFAEAVQLKPNFANAYYNLSYVYQQQAKWLEAYQAMQQAAALVEPESDDGFKVRNELADLEKKLPRTAESTGLAPTGGELAAPSPAPAPPQNLPKIEL